MAISSTATFGTEDAACKQEHKSEYAAVPR